MVYRDRLKGVGGRIYSRLDTPWWAARGVLIGASVLVVLSPCPVDSATCCVNSTSGLAFDSCVCLVDNTQVAGQYLTRGESDLYHWVLEDSSSDLTSSPRGNLTFTLSPCNGSASMDIKSASPASWLYMPSFSSGDSLNPTSLTISVKASEYTVFVTAGNGSDFSTFDISTYNTLFDIPRPGGGGVLTATMPTSSTAEIAINTSESGFGDTMYRLYWSSLSPWIYGDSGQDPPGCVEPSSGVSLMNNSNCMFSSVCGMERAAEGMSDWETLSNSVAYSFEVPVSSTVQYIFNVAMRDSRNITSAYQASNMSFSFKTYQDCVADPDCQSQLLDDTTIITVCISVVVVLALLVGSTVALRSSIRNTMEKATLTNTQGVKLVFRGMGSPSSKPSRRVSEKYSNKTPAEKQRNGNTAFEGRKIHVDDDFDDPYDEYNSGRGTPVVTPAAGTSRLGGGNEDSNDWVDATEAPGRKGSSATRLMKSPRSSQSSDTNSPYSDRQQQQRAPRAEQGKRALAMDDDDEDDHGGGGDRIDQNYKKRKNAVGDGGSGGRSDHGEPAGEDDAASADDDDVRTSSSRPRRKTPQRADRMITKTKGNMQGSPSRSRSRARSPAHADSDKDDVSDGDKDQAESYSSSKPARSRRNNDSRARGRGEQDSDGYYQDLDRDEEQPPEFSRATSPASTLSRRNRRN